MTDFKLHKTRVFKQMKDIVFFINCSISLVITKTGTRLLGRNNFDLPGAITDLTAGLTVIQEKLMLSFVT
jgi:hypothetical protein